MTQRDFQYFITDEQGRTYSVVNGLIVSSALRNPLKFTPDGWQDISIAWERDPVRIGLIRNFTLPLGFVMDGATILRRTFYFENIERKLFLVIQKLTLEIDATNYQWVYKYFYRGELDFSTLRDEANKVSISIGEGGLSKLFHANADTTYEIPFDADAIKIFWDGIFLTENHNFIIPAITTTVEPRASATGEAFQHLVGSGQTTKEGTAAGAASFSVFFKQMPADFNFSTDLRYIFSTTQVITGINLKGWVRVRNLDNLQANYALFLYSSKGHNHTLVSGALSDRTTFVDFPFDFTFDAEADEHFFLVGGLGGYIEGVEYAETSFAITFQSRKAPTYVKAFYALDLFKKLCAKAGIDPAVISSTVLDKSKNLVLTCGNGIRSLQGAAIKTSINQFLDFCNVVHACGFGIENGKLVIEAKPYFLNTTSVQALGEAKDLKISYATDLLANTIKIGYPDQDIDNVNGRYEFNNTHLYTSPLTRVTKELNLVCPYLAQPYLMETIRLNLEGKTTTDNGSDNDTFIVNVDTEHPISFTSGSFSTDGSGSRFYLSNAFAFYDYATRGDTFTLSGTIANNRTFTLNSRAVLPDGRIMVVVYEPVTNEAPITGTITLSTNTFPLKRVTYDSIEGLPANNQIFNIEELTPRRLLQKHFLWYNSIFDGFVGELLKFQTTEKNAALKTVQGGRVVAENEDVMIGSVKLFTPKYIEFENQVPVDVVDTLETAPNTAFSTVGNDTTLKGFSFKLGIAPNTLREQAFKLLSAPDNNFINLL